jgi:anti-sigma B factor antagonist
LEEENPDRAVPARFTVEVRPERDRVVVVPQGELDLATIEPLRSELDGLVERGFAQVVLDLRELEFIDSSGLRLLLQQCRREDAAVSLIDGVGPVKALFDLTGTRGLLRFEPPA